MDLVADRVEMHRNIGVQRDNWNHLLLTSVNGMTATSATMAGLAAICGSSNFGASLALRLSSTILYIAATGVLMVMNKIQPSQLAEEQRNASRLFRQLHEQIKTKIALRNANLNDVKDAVERVLALDRAYPLPLLGAMLNKFPKKVEPAVWWPKQLSLIQEHGFGGEPRRLRDNGWSEKLEDEMREVVGVLKRKDSQEYLRLSKLVLKVNKVLAICGPCFTGLAAIGSAFVGTSSWAVVMGVVFGVLATVVNTIEHGGQVGMVFEMYRSSAGFFMLMEESIESTLEEREVGKRENGELFETEVALKLGRSLEELKHLANLSTTFTSSNRVASEEYASKLF
ncbi:hypothetical protein HYC85_014852 [Camellia sinensis]|uniref:F-box protein n=1 Tax=Camellia sinensis TaxID=4442 RepID=A0A7J7H8I9_CAMSI|nr:hypothetical protein HYC85_014852 [Camellia sinensis]